MILLIGPPASGKGALSFELKKKLNFDIFCLGEFLRYHIDSKTNFGISIESKINRGEILKFAEISSELDLSVFSNSKTILDGFPRSLDQAIGFDNFIKQNNLKIDCVLELSCESETLIKRIIERTVCRNCSYTCKFNEKQCAECGSKLLQKRCDDDLSIFQKRLLNYKNNLLDIKDFYKNKVCYYKIQANDSIKNIYSAVSKLLKYNDVASNLRI